MVVHNDIHQLTHDAYHICGCFQQHLTYWVLVVLALSPDEFPEGVLFEEAVFCELFWAIVFINVDELIPKIFAASLIGSFKNDSKSEERESLVELS